ncbi:hypothetical protein PVT71_21180 [Salipiger sp. H15]|uniref:Secreted protein n=1 Tax=Alloyangia sp. H15 TaxID=3029062 RepID=A0AAU8ALJ3_9RHOB
MFRTACLALLLIAPAAPLAAQGQSVPLADLDAAPTRTPGYRWPNRPDWPSRPGYPQQPGSPGTPGRGDWGHGDWGHGDWSGNWGGNWGWGGGYGGYGGLGASLDLGTRVPGADGSVREPVMTIERDSPARTRQIRNSPGAPVVSAPQSAASRLPQPPIVERAPIATAPLQPGPAQQGAGELNGGGAALGQVLSADGENYVLLLTLPESRVTCMGQLDGPPALFPSMGSALACSDGAQGNALFATPEEGAGSSASFTLDGGRGGYLVFP